MKHFLEIIKDNNFILRLGSLNFSTMKDLRAKFEDDKGNVIIWGLNEYKKPPTLCYPRPHILIKKIVENEIITLSQINDDAMNYVLLNEPHEKIFEAIFNKDIFFEYDLTKNPTN